MRSGDILDNHGVELVDFVAAAREAVRRALQIQTSEVLQDAHRRNGAIVVDDEFSTVLEVPVTSSQDGFVPLLERD